jgi:hypothetical protein
MVRSKVIENCRGLSVLGPAWAISIPKVRGSAVPGVYPAAIAATGGLVYLTKTGKVCTPTPRAMEIVRPSRGSVVVLLVCSDIFPFGVQVGVSLPPPPPPQDTSRDRTAIITAHLSEIVFMSSSSLLRQISRTSGSRRP